MIIIMIIIIISYIIINKDNMHFNMTVIEFLTYSFPMTTDDCYYRTIFRTYLQVIKCINVFK